MKPVGASDQARSAGEEKIYREICELSAAKGGESVHPIELAKFIRQQMIDKFSKSDILLTPNSLRNVRTWNMLIDKVKFLFRLCQSEEAKKYFNDFYSVLLFRIDKNYVKKIYRTKKNKYDSNSFIKFSTCPLCWRYVPHMGYGKVKEPFCHFHDPITMQGEYRKAKRILKDYKKLWVLTKDINKCFFDDLLSSHNRNYDLLHNDAIFSNPELFSVKKYDFDLGGVWPVLKLLKDFITENEGDISSPLSVVYTMNPPEPNEHELIREKRHMLYQLFANDMALHLARMCHAEAWLRLIKERKDNHGGRRAGAGYPKGRPRKCIMAN